MSEIQQNSRQDQLKEDEVDIRKLFEAIGGFFTWIWRGIMDLIVLFRRETLHHKILILSLAILGGLSGFISQKIGKPYYKSSMLINSSILGGQIFENIVLKLDLLTGENNKEELAATLGITEEEAGKIRGFEAVPFITEEEVIRGELLIEQLKDLNLGEKEIEIIDRVQLENKSIYEIIVMAYETDVTDGLEESILNYFKQIPYIHKRLEINKRIREQQILKLKLEAQKLDSLKGIVYNNVGKITDRARQGSNNVILADDNSSNPLSIFREELSLYYQELEVQKLLDLEEELEIVDGFTISKVAENMEFRQNTLWGILAGIALSYLFIILRLINSYLSKFEKARISKSID